MIESSRSLDDQSANPSRDTHTLEKLVRLGGHVQHLVQLLTDHNTIPVHHQINQSYYMQKRVELMLLCDQLSSAQRQLDQWSIGPTIITVKYS